mgnify:CR=1 FL=1
MEAILVVVATLIAGIAGYNYMNPTAAPTEPVPVVQAETTPTKVEPEAVEPAPLPEPAKKKARKKSAQLPTDPAKLNKTKRKVCKVEGQ